jgi:predicted secreted hydrolase
MDTITGSSELRATESAKFKGLGSLATRWAAIAAAAIAMAGWTGLLHAAPLGIPVPSEIGIDDLLSTSTESGDGQGLPPGAGACDSAAHPAISLPADDAPHDDTYIEFWWWYGHLVAPEGRRFAFLVWFASKPSEHIQWADYTLTDLSTGTFHYGREPLILGRPAATEDGFELRGDQGSATGGDGHDELHFYVDGYELDLSLESIKPPVIHLGDGYMTLYCNSSYFYSRPRMRTVGTLSQGGTTVPVTGTSNFLRQWGFNVALEVANTTYLSFQLDDGRDVSLGVARLRQDGEEATLRLGSISDAQGNVTTLHSGDFSIVPTGFWRRDASCSDPVEYDITVEGLHLHARPSLQQAEVRATRWPLLFALWPAWPVYWDGETIIDGDATGRGWMDLNRFCLY